MHVLHGLQTQSAGLLASCSLVLAGSFSLCCYFFPLKFLPLCMWQGITELGLRSSPYVCETVAWSSILRTSTQLLP